MGNWNEQFMKGMDELESVCAQAPRDALDELCIRVERIFNPIGSGVQASTRLRKLAEATKSPIEQAMMLGLIAARTALCYDEKTLIRIDEKSHPEWKWVDITHSILLTDEDFKQQKAASAKAVEESFLCIWPQAPVAQYSADFLVEYFGTVRKSGPEREDVPVHVSCVVECDGHDYHERTKQQAAHDRARDRFMQQAGHMVLRFTGSEIWGDPVGCALQAIHTIQDKEILIRLGAWGVKPNEEPTPVGWDRYRRYRELARSKS